MAAKMLAAAVLKDASTKGAEAKKGGRFHDAVLLHNFYEQRSLPVTFVSCC